MATAIDDNAAYENQSSQYSVQSHVAKRIANIRLTIRCTRCLKADLRIIMDGENSEKRDRENT